MKMEEKKEYDKKFFEIGYKRIQKEISELEKAGHKKSKISEVLKWKLGNTPSTPNFEGGRKALEDYKNGSD